MECAVGKARAGTAGRSALERRNVEVVRAPYAAVESRTYHFDTVALRDFLARHAGARCTRDPRPPPVGSR